MFNYFQECYDYCDKYMEWAVEKTVFKNYAKELKKLFKEIQQEEISEVDLKFFEKRFHKSWSVSLLPKSLPLNVLKQIVKELYNHHKHPYSKKSNTIAMYVLLLSKFEQNWCQEANFSLTPTEILDYFTNYMIEAGHEILFREKWFEYEAAQSIEEILKRKKISISNIKQNEWSLTFRCSPVDIKDLDLFLEKVNKYFPHDFTQIDILLALILTSSESLVVKDWAFIKHLKKITVQDPKLTQKKTYKFTESHVSILFESLSKCIEDIFKNVSYSSGDIFRAMIAFSKEVPVINVAGLIKDIRRNN